MEYAVFPAKYLNNISRKIFKAQGWYKSSPSRDTELCSLLDVNRTIEAITAICLVKENYIAGMVVIIAHVHFQLAANVSAHIQCTMVMPSTY